MVLGLVVNIFLFFAVISNLFCRYGDSKKGNYTYFFMILSLLLVTDRLFGFIFNIIPFSNIFRFFIILYLFISKKSESSRILYKFYVQPFLVTYEATFKFFIDFFRTKVYEYLDTTTRRTSVQIRNVAPSFTQMSSLGSSVKSLTDQIRKEPEVDEHEELNDSGMEESESSRNKED